MKAMKVLALNYITFVVVVNGVIAETDAVLGNEARYADEYGGAVFM